MGASQEEKEMAVATEDEGNEAHTPDHKEEEEKEEMKEDKYEATEGS